MEQISNYQQVYQHQDPSFDVGQLSSYRLVMKVGQSHLTYGIVEMSSGRFAALEQFAYSTANSDTSLVVRLQNIHNTHPILSGKYWGDIVVLVNGLAFSTLPKDFFDEAAIPDILSFSNQKLPSSPVFFHNEISGFDTVVPFAVGSQLVEWFKTEYSDDVQFMHVTAAFLQGLSSLSPLSGTAINIFADKEKATIALVEGHKLRFVNTFNYQDHAGNLLFYILSVLKELSLEPKNTSIKIWGDIAEDSEFTTLVRKNLNTVYFGKKIDGAVFSTELNNLPDHFNIDLYAAGIQ